MNIVLIRPPKISGAFEKILIQEPINLAYITAYLKSKGLEAQIWDFEVESFSLEILRKKVGQSIPSIVGITAMSPTINNAHSVALMLKTINPQIKIIAGGPHVSAIPEQSLREFPAFDYVVIGEGEITMFNIAQEIDCEEKLVLLPGLAYRKNSNIIINQPQTYISLNLLPFPDRTQFNPASYKHIYAAGLNTRPVKSTVVFSSRGCPQNCTFCAAAKTQGSTVRFRSAENVIDEIRLCRDRFHYNHITFEDTNLTFNRERFKKICQGLKKLGLTWDCQTKVNFVDKELIQIMKNSGCLKIAYGVESGSPRMLKLMKKNITLSQIKDAFYWTKQANIVACAFFILGGHPEETKQDIKQTEQILHLIQPDVFQLSIICPYPGTEIYNIMRKENLIKELDWSKLNFMHSVPSWGTKYITAKELVKFQRVIYLRYLFSPKFMAEYFKKRFTLKQLLYQIKLCIYIFNYLVFERRR